MRGEELDLAVAMGQAKQKGNKIYDKHGRLIGYRYKRRKEAWRVKGHRATAKKASWVEKRPDRRKTRKRKK